VGSSITLAGNEVVSSSFHFGSKTIMTKKYFLQVEAVNIQSFVYDTNDISTIRGGSYVLMDTIKNQLVPWLAKKNW
jgi:hypothetical protein